MYISYVLSEKFFLESIDWQHPVTPLTHGKKITVILRYNFSKQTMIIFCISHTCGCVMKSLEPGGLLQQGE